MYHLDSCYYKSEKSKITRVAVNRNKNVNVLPALNLSIHDTGILIMVQQARLMMLDYPMSFLLLSTSSRGDHSE